MTRARLTAFALTLASSAQATHARRIASKCVRGVTY